MYGFIFEEPFKTKNFVTTVAVRPGIGKKILLIHGIACTKEIWFVYPILFPTRYFVAYDQRGFGTGIALDNKYTFDKYVEDALAVAKHYKPDLIVGHSYGGAVAQVVSALTRIPAVILESTAYPPEGLNKESVKTIRMDMQQAISDSLLNYLASPGLILYALNILKYNPDMPAMDHLDELLDFLNLCYYDMKGDLVKIMGGLRDTIARPSAVRFIGKCAEKKVEFFDVNHLGILYPDFVRASLVY